MIKRLLRKAYLTTVIPLMVSMPSLAETAIEFYNVSLNHYFITADVAEQSAIDKGLAGAGWQRTGINFTVWPVNQSPNAQNVCRFYSKALNSHFYTADASECAFVKKYDKSWQYEGYAFAVELATNNSNCAAGSAPVYRIYNNGFAKPVGSNHRFLPDLTLAQKFAATTGGSLENSGKPVFCAPLSTLEKRADAVRLLKQASFGPTFSEIAKVESLGSAAWIDEQLAMPSSKYSVREWVTPTRPDSCINDTALPISANSYCSRDNYTLFIPQKEFWQQALLNPDQLRQRMAWAWSQFFVVSGTRIGQAYGMLDYQQLLRDNAFANFAILLKAVTLHPAMGSYLDMVNNQKPDIVKGIQPNENYAREVLQLFSIGLNTLNLDGTPVLDSKQRPIPTYDMEDIEGYAHVFTGWTFPTRPPAAYNPNRLNTRNWMGVMEPHETFHDRNEKQLLEGKKSTAGLNAQSDLDFALNTIFEHRNVAPFVSRFLIQKFVTGNPSSQYVARVATVFENNGSGVRGDMQALIKAILLDPEARGAQKLDDSYGQLLEPVLLITQNARALNVKTDGFWFQQQGSALEQIVFRSPSVFNYYPPDYALAKSGINAPEFAILNSSTALARLNIANTMLMGNNVAPSNALFMATGTQYDWSSFVALAGNSDALIDKVAEILQGLPFNAQVKSTIKTAVEAIASDQLLLRAKTAFYLAAAAPVAQIQR